MRRPEAALPKVMWHVGLPNISIWGTSSYCFCLFSVVSFSFISVSTAFHTPRPPGIQTGVRDVPLVSQHVEDLYDALEVEFTNPQPKGIRRGLHLKSVGLIRHLTMMQETWRELPSIEKGSHEWNRRAKVLKHIEIEMNALNA